MAVTITPEELYYGTPVTLTYGGVDVGGTTEPPTVNIEVTEAHPDFENAAGPIVGTSVITDVMASVDLMVNQMTAQKLAWALPGSTSVTTSIAVVGGGGATTLTSAAVVGDTVINVASATGLLVNDWIRIGAAGPTASYRQITNIASLALTLDHALNFAHANASSVTEVEGNGQQTISWTVGRVPTASYLPLVLVGEGLDGRRMTTTITNALSAENISLPFGKGQFGGLSMRFVGHYASTTPTTVPFSIVFGPA